MLTPSRHSSFFSQPQVLFYIFGVHSIFLCLVDMQWLTHLNTALNCFSECIKNPHALYQILTHLGNYLHLRNSGM